MNLEPTLLDFIAIPGDSTDDTLRDYTFRGQFLCDECAQTIVACCIFAGIFDDGDENHFPQTLLDGRGRCSQCDA